MEQQQAFFTLPLSRLEKTFKSWLRDVLEENQAEPTDADPQNPMADYIQKKEVVGKLASGSTLWKYEREGKLPVYGVGGKRFYRRADIENLFTRINH